MQALMKEAPFFGQELAPSQDDRSLIALIDHVLVTAIEKNASDVHFEPYEHFYRIRHRLDGQLEEVLRPPLALASRIASRLKLIANLDIAERRLPQDGRFKLLDSQHKDIDLRISTCPTALGEKIVVRILKQDASSLNLENLGLSLSQKHCFLNAIHQSQGMILVSGATGSGKTMTLYTALSLLNTEKVNIASAEDPIEITMPGINQVAMNRKTGLSFSKILGAFLRQDPDIIMLGEMRDFETAEMAFKAAQTGHLLLSTLHANSAAESITRLRNLGISSFNIASSLSLVIHQRLVRKLCAKCKTLRNDLSFKKLKALGLGHLGEGILCSYQAKGCSHCSQGYLGRTGIFELMPVSQALAQKIIEEAPALAILQAALAEGMQSLKAAALAAVENGLSSLEEVLPICRGPL